MKRRSVLEVWTKTKTSKLVSRRYFDDDVKAVRAYVRAAVRHPDCRLDLFWAKSKEPA